MNRQQTVHIEDGKLADISFKPSTTVTYRLSDKAVVNGRTIIIPDGFTAKERENIRQALSQAVEAEK